ncbi:Na+/H+ antiporter NhaD [Actinopolymorpha cephalotaxi]|uniref:Na+/H+ antiporter NhaD n=1 Tax=Actinopolymorpha cephalotaxi TaxID=504797 RepID=A0A1I3B5X3_9ACTN|nr:ArsB/NhaD family transporter [Actinopolymorpha cephalotaxi]NYH81252.1 Na+/H+ antiporter NhaD/arsenite permease-like protein [Actinopolymorpha cephalotaxi]SFH57359.1 Na+/H+ antiporter NhaD [Actinopolymorpha cephalotaxi]
MSLWIAVAAFVVAYTLIATERVPRLAAALGGAGVVLALGIVGAHDVFYSAESGIDWNVVFLLLGMMIIVGVLRQTGIFEFLAIWAAKRARGRPYRVLVLLCLLTAVASALLDNVTTVLLIAPVTLLVCQRIGVRPEPFLVAEVLASNIGGTSTLVGDPPNIIIASRAGLSFNDFLVNLAPFIVVLLVVFLGLCRWLFRRAFEADPERVAEVMSLSEREAISDVPLLRRSLVVLAGVLLGFVLHPVLHVEPSIVALLGAGVLVLLSGLSSGAYLEEVEWETLVFFMGLFVMVGALVKVGVIDTIAHWLAEATGGKAALAIGVVLVGSALLSAIVDNIPFVATMAPVVAELTGPHGPLAGQTGLWWALALGADLGGNATAVGASANVVALGIAKRNGFPISFWEFTKYGALVAAISVALALPYLLLRYA